MTIKRRSKFSRMRGTHTHGWGDKKKHRGAGSRGGRGNAGFGKKCSARRPSVWKIKYFGKKKFNPHNTKQIVSVNLDYFENHLQSLIDKKMMSKEGNFYVVDVTKLGFDKVLGKGKLKNKFKIIAPCFSESAKRKLEESGSTFEEGFNSLPKEA